MNKFILVAICNVIMAVGLMLFFDNTLERMIVLSICAIIWGLVLGKILARFD